MNWRKVMIGMWSWKRPFLSLASIYVLLALIAVFFTDRLLFVPPPSSYDAGHPALIWLDGQDGARLAAIWHPPQDGMPVLLYAHGNAEDIGDNRPIFRSWARKGLGVLGYDYPGYGLSDGRPSEAGANASARAAWDWLMQHGVEPSSIVLVGRSVGGGPTLWLDSQVNAAGVVLISPFTSVYRVPFGISPFPRDRFPNIDRIRQSKTPLLVIHGVRDEVIPFHHGRKIHKHSASENKQMIPIDGAGHNDLFEVAGPRILSEVAEFATTVATP